MICEKCKDQGGKSRVYPGIPTTTSMYYHPYYDEDGNFVDENPNTITWSHRCSNGHRWDIRTTLGETTVEWKEDEPPPEKQKQKPIPTPAEAGRILVCRDGEVSWETQSAMQ